MLQDFATQLVTVTASSQIAFLVVAVLMGLLFGAIPGLTATLAVALLGTLTFNLSYEIALICLLGSYVGAIYGPVHSSVLLGIPGTPSGAATALDGYVLTKKGRGGQTISTATIASAVGTILGTIAVLFVAPLMVDLSLQFTSAEFFLLALFGVMICGSLTAPDLPVKGWISGVLGLMLASVGIETIQGYARFTGGLADLSTGVGIVPAILGAFAIPQILRVLGRSQSTFAPESVEVGTLRPAFGELWRMKFGIVRSGAIGVGVGSVPGVGEDIAAWASYDVGKNVDKEPASFGKGNIRGVICAETANNACIGGALIPVLALGIPGSAPAAMLLGALNLHGIRPGPMLPIEFPQLIPQMAATLVLASLVMLVLGIALTKVSMQILRVPVEVLMPFVAFISVLGAYALGLNIFNVYVMLGIGLLAYFMEENGYPVAPAVIGLILGNMADTGLRRALLGSEGSLEPFFTRPVALVLIGLIAVTFALRSAAVKTLRAHAQRLWRQRPTLKPDR